MKNIILSVFLFLSVVGFSQDRSLYQANHFIVEKDTLPYRILFPEGYDGMKEYPLVVFLHGAGERGNDNESQLQWGANLFLENREKYPAIVVFPQCAKDDYWAKIKYRKKRKIGKRFRFPLSVGKPTTSLKLAYSLIQNLIKEEAVNPKRIYVAGLSMGGMGTFEMLARFPDKFAAAIPICGGGNPNHTFNYAKKTSLWIFHGDADPVVGVRHSRRMAKQLKKFKADIKYTEYKEVDHLSWIPAFEEPDFLEWLFSKEL